MIQHQSWPSPAKLNLFLHINGQLDNGYHQLQSLFQLLDYGDSLEFAITRDSEINITTPIAGVAIQDNLIFKAAKLLQEFSECKLGCDISLNKVLPMGGGIGGGSSNAATTLVALNYLWDIHLPIEELAQLGLKLGADVPIFVRGQTAFAEGVGEKLYPVELPEQYYLVVFPNCHVSTADVFGHPELPRNTPVIDFSQYRFETTHNDCQQLVCDLYPDVAKVLHRLLEYAPSRMTGTGACVFAIFDERSAAESALQSIASDVSAFVAKGVNTSPLHCKLASLTTPNG